RHVDKTIIKERSSVLDMGNLVHALALQPEQLDEEFSVEPIIPLPTFLTSSVSVECWLVSVFTHFGSSGSLIPSTNSPR
ncbi:hypothetical protein, partial [Citrobacter braakii]|uniref:hypothetical protein n=1 Tax=Citrobacter braakii TaxID=57706 RepID=UPI0037BF047C